MAVIARSGWASDVLINYVTDEIRTLEPALLFAGLGVQKTIPKGFDTLTFPQSNQVATSSVSTITEGTNPSEISWGATAYKGSPTQYGLIIKVSDLLVRNSALEVIMTAVRQVKLALARQIDNGIQATLLAMTNGVIYAGGKASRATVAAGDLADTTMLVRLQRNLLNTNNDPFEGDYFALALTPSVHADLMLNSSAGSWSDVGRYTNVADLKAGKMGDFRGFRFLVSQNVQTVSSTVTVHPSFAIANRGFGWGYFQEPTPTLVTTPDSNNALAVFNTIGAKATIGVTKFEDSSTAYRVARMESAVSA